MTTQSQTTPAATFAYYLDSSALIKRYVQERGSRRVIDILVQSATYYTIALTRLEVVAALTRRHAEVTVDALDLFDADYRYGFEEVDLQRGLISIAERVIRAHRLRGCDSLQLAAALLVATEEPSLVFVSADDDLNKAAAAEGLAVENPNNA